ncbi:hypothetical protein [uncultured Limosilactobacillus sp.]|uniref:hypothetical protein n=1 Tax=uncultured Limosilactobacillus sp. TaxID=2837629 RepID=UPI0025F4CFEB|nr:hypothetical protein [uncultured Limosilactobacillus sp.]
MTKQVKPVYQACWVIFCVLLCLGVALGGKHYRQQKNWHRFAGTYYAYVPDNGQVHKVKLTIPADHQVATLKIVDSTRGESPHVKKVNRLKINSGHQTMTVIGYPGTPADHYRHVATTIQLTTAGKTRTYYREGTPQQQKREKHFQQ